VLDGALDSVRALRDTRGNSVVDVILPALARRASGDKRAALIRELLIAIAAMSDGERAAWKIDEIADLLSAPDYEELLDAAPAIAMRSSADLQQFERLVLEVELLRGLREPARSRTFDDVLSDVPKLEEAYVQRNILVTAARHAPDIAFPRVVDAAVAIPDPIMRAMTLTLLLAHVPGDERSVVRHISEIRELDEPMSSEQRRLAEITAARMLEQLPLDQPVNMIAGFEDEDARSIGLVGVAPRIGADDHERALEIAHGIENRDARCKALLALAKIMTEGADALVEEALAYALTDDPDVVDGELLESVVSRVVELPPARLGSAWAVTANRLASCPRPALVGQLVYLIPMLARGGGDRMLRATAAALGDVARWFP
jgi:hypothetical protein